MLPCGCRQSFICAASPLLPLEGSLLFRTEHRAPFGLLLSQLQSLEKLIWDFISYVFNFSISPGLLEALPSLPALWEVLWQQTEGSSGSESCQLPPQQWDGSRTRGNFQH